MPSKSRLFAVSILFLDWRNHIVCTWDNELSGLDPADVTHIGLLKARIALGAKLLSTSRMDIRVREIDPYRKEPVLYPVDVELDIAV